MSGPGPAAAPHAVSGPVEPAPHTAAPDGAATPGSAVHARPAGDPALAHSASTASTGAASGVAEAQGAAPAAPQQALRTASGLAADPQAPSAVAAPQVPSAGSAAGPPSATPDPAHGGATTAAPAAGSGAGPRQGSPAGAPGLTGSDGAAENSASSQAASSEAVSAVRSAALGAAPSAVPGAGPQPGPRAGVVGPTGPSAGPQPSPRAGETGPGGPVGAPGGSAPSRVAAADAPAAPAAGSPAVSPGLASGGGAARDLGPRADSGAPAAVSGAAPRPGSHGAAPGLARPGEAPGGAATSRTPSSGADAPAASPRPAGPDSVKGGPGSLPDAAGEAPAVKAAVTGASAPAAAGSGGSPQQARPGLRPAAPGLTRAGAASGGPAPSGAAPQPGPLAASPGQVRPAAAPGTPAPHTASTTPSAESGPAAGGSATARPVGSGGPRATGEGPAADQGARTAVPSGAAAGPGAASTGAVTLDDPATKGAVPAGSAAGARATAAEPGREKAVDPRLAAGGRVRTVAVPVAASVEVVPRGGDSHADGNTSNNGKPGNNRNNNPSNTLSNNNPSNNRNNNVSNGSARRRNVIGAETTGSIPVHLLFRDEPGGADDGGPATVPVPKLSRTPGASTAAPRKGKGRASVPGPARHAAAPARPAPTADPKLVERSGPVLPGWVGVAGGVLALAACAALVWWTGAVPAEVTRMLHVPSRPYHGIHLWQWALLASGVALTLFFLGGLGRGRVGYALVLTLFGDYRGTVRRTGLLWVSPLLLRRRVDVRLRHWRSGPLPAVDAKGTALDVVVLVVWRIRDTVRAVLGVDRHEEYLREQVEAAMARVLSQLPADAFHEDAPTLRDSEAVGEALTRLLSAECAPVGIDVFSVQPTRIEYAPEVAAAMQRRRIAAIDAKHRDSVLTSVVDAVDDVVHRLTSRGLVELDDYERKALVKDLTVAFYTGRTAPVEGA
ncbi:SPFH domain-containing protein [Streptomyces sp. NPDC101158]|uniref:SPFH domain-containing protein n=1 Tax=Streptomyces sp. NPDC101158 TaxID=3366117 RepID=UPI003814B4C9